MWVKICANTNLEDAQMAAELGADAVGFVFAPSSRQVTPEQVAAITSRLPDGLERVGVFGLATAEEIAGAALDAGLTGVQLHGNPDAELVSEVRMRLGPEVTIIQTLHWTLNPRRTEDEDGDAGDTMPAELAGQLERLQGWNAVERVLVDTKLGTKAGGGTGVTFDWDSAGQVFAGVPERLRLIVAGGLTPENVAQAIRKLRPWGVDVASGVEASPGKKDPARLAQFLANAHGADTA